MGMFDSFIVEQGGLVEEVQTKELACCMYTWYLGDRVMEAKGARYIVEDSSAGRWYGFIIWDGVWVDTVSADTEDEAHDRAQELLVSWKDPEYRAQHLLALAGRSGQLHRDLGRLRSELYALRSCHRDPNTARFYFREEGKIYEPEFLAPSFPPTPPEEQLPYLVDRVVEAYTKTFGVGGGIISHPTLADRRAFYALAGEEPEE